VEGKRGGKRGGLNCMLDEPLGHEKKASKTQKKKGIFRWKKRPIRSIAEEQRWATFYQATGLFPNRKESVQQSSYARGSADAGRFIVWWFT